MAAYLYPSYTQGELAPQAQAFLQRLAKAQLPATHSLTPVQGRESTWPAMRRLAPEHRYPAAVEDAYAATVWAATNADRIRGDPSFIAVGGDSAGGNLAAVVSLIARQQGSPALAHQLPICPITNVSAFDTESYRYFGEGLWSLRALAQWAVSFYLSDEALVQQPFVSPLLAEDLRGLPAATVITAEFDTLRDEGEAYAQRLREAGVEVRCTRYHGVLHDFPILAGVFDQAKDVIDEAATALRSAFSK